MLGTVSSACGFYFLLSFHPVQMFNDLKQKEPDSTIVSMMDKTMNEVSKFEQSENGKKISNYYHKLSEKTAVVTTEIIKYAQKKSPQAPHTSLFSTNDYNKVTLSTISNKPKEK